MAVTTAERNPASPSASSPSSSPRPLKKVLVLLSTCVAIVLAAEVGLRLAGHDPVGEQLKGVQALIRESEDESVAYVMAPNSEVEVWGHKVTTNSLGFRSRETTPRKKDGVLRVLAIGDSVTFGPGMHNHETWPAQLEKRWREKDIKAEVINMGIPGYDPEKEVALLKSAGLALEPDEVIVCFCINDVATVTFAPDTVRDFERYGSGILSWSRAAQAVVHALRGREVVAQEREFSAAEDEQLATLEVTPDPVLDRLFAKLEAAMEAAGEPTVNVDKLNRKQRLGWYREPARLQRVRDAYADLAELSREHGFGVTLFASPIIYEGIDVEAWHVAYEMIQHLAEDAGFRFVDVYPDLKNEEFHLLHTKKKDLVHLNARAHKTMARVLARETRHWFQKAQ